MLRVNSIVGWACAHRTRSSIPQDQGKVEEKEKSKKRKTAPKKKKEKHHDSLSPP